MKITSFIHTAFAVALLLLALPGAPAASAASPAVTSDVPPPPADSQTTPPDSAPPRSEDETYSADEIVQKAAGFFGATTEAVAKAVERIFSRYGRPNAYIAGGEGSGAFFVGLRYGEGDLYMKSNNDRPVKVYWQGPSIGFDFGANASKTFTLVYNLPSPEAIYERFPGIEGSAYFVAGIGVNYQQSGRVVLAPMRTGVGLRAGVNGGYLSYAKQRNWIPF
ncbi:MAG TPA: DUF1134 domain-containing protein [Micropepsaceae bacterium]|jgi:hypothetical protein|nr:DUF1134 domain-containing protein [Micropepsaceae bacterium]